MGYLILSHLLAPKKHLLNNFFNVFKQYNFVFYYPSGLLILHLTETTTKLLQELARYRQCISSMTRDRIRRAVRRSETTDQKGKIILRKKDETTQGMPFN